MEQSLIKPKVPPVVVVLAAGALMWGIDAGFPGMAISFAGLRVVAWALVVAGVGVIAAGISTFSRARTTTDPLNPERASVLVTDGIYRFTRNPMYLGMAIVLAAWALFLANAASLLVVIAFVASMTRFQIKAEEQALEKAFGEAYRQYKATVRRWI